MNLNKLMGGKRKVKDDKDSDLKLFYNTLLSTTNDNGIYLLGKQNWHDNSLEFTFSLDDSYKKNIAKIKIPSGSYNEMKKNLFVQMGKWLSKLNGENKHGLSSEFVKDMNELYYHLMSELNSQVSDSRRVKDGNNLSKKLSKSDIDYLLSEGNREKDIEQIQEALDYATFEIFQLNNNYEEGSNKEVSFGRAINFVGREGVLSALARAAFHRSGTYEDNRKGVHVNVDKSFWD